MNIVPNKTRYALNTLLQRAFREGRIDMSPMKAQKMLFFTHGWHLAITGRPAIDQQFEVWQYGPVVGQLYHDLKKYGSSQITDYVKDELEEKVFVISPKNAEFYTSLDVAWEKYIGITAGSLSTMTHMPNTPWAVARDKGLSLIPNDIIRDYFVEQARKQ